MKYVLAITFLTVPLTFCAAQALPGNSGDFGRTKTVPAGWAFLDTTPSLRYGHTWLNEVAPQNQPTFLQARPSTRYGHSWNSPQPPVHPASLTSPLGVTAGSPLPGVKSSATRSATQASGGGTGRAVARPATSSGADCRHCEDAHAGLHFNNDFSYLDSPEGRKAACFGDSLKRLYKQNDRWLDIGGNFRLRYHNEEQLGRQAGTQLLEDGTSTPGLMQLRLYADYHLDKSVRLYAEGLYADVVNANAGYVPRGTDRNVVDFLNLFVDVDLSDSTTLRVGRQQNRYGSRRLIAGPGWANTSRNHDGFKVIHKQGARQTDAFYFHPVTINVGRIDAPADDRRLFGIWSATKSAETDDVSDLYYVGFEDRRPGSERFLHNFGARVKGGKDWLYELEAIGQFGRQAARGQDHLAAMCVAGVGKSFANALWKPTLWAYFDFATGEDGSGDFNRYDRVFDRAHNYLGFVDTVSRSNVEIFSLALTLHPTERLELLSRYYKVYAQQDQDTVSGVQGVIADQRFDTNDYGEIFDVVAKLDIAARMDISLGFSYFLPGDKPLSQNNASLAYLEWNVRF